MSWITVADGFSLKYMVVEGDDAIELNSSDLHESLVVFKETSPLLFLFFNELLMEHSE